MYGKLAQWLKFCAVNHDIMGSNPAETVYIFFTCVLFNHLKFVVDVFAYQCCLFIYNHNNAHTT